MLKEQIGNCRAVALHQSLPCAKGGAPKGRRDCRRRKCEFALDLGENVTYYRTIPQSPPKGRRQPPLHKGALRER